MDILKKFANRLLTSAPFIIIILVALTIAIKNITPNTYFSGWDNMHPEWNLLEYTKRVFFGAWVEFQGTGAPAAQSQLAEITRLPFIYLLKLLLPDNLVRYSFHFLMFLIGGIGMYLYLKKIWLSKVGGAWRDWIASFGATFYLLNIITLQKFFISFELFAVQFAFLPFVFISIHRLSENFNVKTILKFILVQLLIAPYGYNPSIYYLSAAFFICYGFFVNFQLHKSLVEALKMAIILGLLTFLSNAYWVVPNLYYLFHNAHYVNESRANQLFDVEALWSVREAGTLQNFLTGIHYIFDWKDLNFQDFQYEFVYKNWNLYLSNPIRLFIIILFNIISIGGFFNLLFDGKKGSKRWGFILIFICTTVLIWNGLFIPTSVFNSIFKIGFILDAFRNLFTKLSNVYGFIITILLIQYYEFVVSYLRSKKSYLVSTLSPIVILSVSFICIFYASLPSFTGNFINDKLRINFPDEYFQMFSFLKTQSPDQRLLELPFYSQSPWVYFNWNTDQNVNGYQGMGFYFFGFPQALLTPDHARWTESTDFFYHELRHALNTTNSSQLKNVLEKYNVNLILVDKTAVNPSQQNYNYQRIHQLLSEAGYSVIWKKNFLTIYEHQSPYKLGKLIIPRQINFVSAKTDRVRRDYVYENIGEYVKTTDKKADILFPFIDFSSLYVNDAVFQKDKLTVQRKIPTGNYIIKIPGLSNNIYSTVAQIMYNGQGVQVIFPETKIILGEDEVVLPQLKNVFIPVKQDNNSVVLTVNDQRIVINKNQTLYSQLSIDLNQPVQFSLATNQSSTQVDIQQPLWEAWKEDINITARDLDTVKIETIFPKISADLKKYQSKNCSQPKQGSIDTRYEQNRTIYTSNGFGVNCNYYSFDSFTPNSSYLMQITGENYSGRSIKFFVNSNVPNTIREDYIMPEKKFKTTLSFLPITIQSRSKYSLNWETRSYGKTAKNMLSDISIMPKQLDRLSQIQLQKKVNQAPLINTVKVNSTKSYFNFLYFINADCKGSNCYVGIDQSFDDLWISIDGKFRLLPHLRYNNWTNLWQIDSSSKIIIIYIPEVISLVCLLSLSASLVVLLIKSKQVKN